MLSILELVARPSSRASSQPRDQTQVSCIAVGFFTSWATREALFDIKVFDFDEVQFIYLFVADALCHI